MKKQIYDEKNGMSYTLHGDYYLPDLVLREEEPTYGKYGMLRKQFLKEYRSARYQYLLLTGKLNEHLNQIDQESRKQMEMLMGQMVERQGVTEELKVQDQMKWVRLMNNIKASAEEIVLKNMVYNKFSLEMEAATINAFKNADNMDKNHFSGWFVGIWGQYSNSPEIEGQGTTVSLKKLRDDLNSVMQEYKEKGKNIAAGHTQNFIKKLEAIIKTESEDTTVEQ